MKRIMLKVAYDGTGYHGYQIQDGCATIEGELNKAICKLTKVDNVELIGGSRTDAGVHAMANICVFDTDSSIPGDRFMFALNQLLPDDIVVVSSCETEPDFHPRHCDSVKTYEYKIYSSDLPNPLLDRYSAHTYYKLDLERMQKAASYIVGEHDFSAFCAAGAQVDSKVRTVYECKVENAGKEDAGNTKQNTPDTFYHGEYDITVSGNGFLYNMVRIIAGTLIEAGRGHIEPEAVKDIIESKDRANAGPTAPACGLVLKEYAFCKCG